MLVVANGKSNEPKVLSHQKNTTTGERTTVQGVPIYLNCMLYLISLTAFGGEEEEEEKKSPAMGT